MRQASNLTFSDDLCADHDQTVEWWTFEKLRPGTRQTFQQSKFNWCVCCVVELATEHRTTIPAMIRFLDENT